MITIQSGKMIIPERERFIGFAGDNNASQKQFQILDISDETFIYRLYLTFDDGTCNYFLLEKSVGESSTTLTWNIVEEHIFKSGVVKAQIKAISSDGEIYHTDSDYFIVLPSAEETEFFANKQNSEFLRYERFLNTILDNIEITQQSLPYIGDDGYWYVYDADEGRYIKTDFTACCDDERHIIRVDGEMSSTSDNPVKNKTVKSYVDYTRSNLVEKTRKIANLPLSSDITVQQLITALGVSNVYQGTATYPSETNHINGDGYLNVITNDFFVFYSSNEAGQKWVKINGSSINIDTGLNHSDSDEYVLSERALVQNFTRLTFAQAEPIGEGDEGVKGELRWVTSTQKLFICIESSIDASLWEEIPTSEAITTLLQNYVSKSKIKSSYSTAQDDVYGATYINTELGKKLNQSNVKVNYYTEPGAVYDVTYMNSALSNYIPKITNPGGSVGNGRLVVTKSDGTLDITGTAASSLARKTDVPNVKSVYSETSGEVYDVIYINSLCERIEQLEQQVSGAA